MLGDHAVVGEFWKSGDACPAAVSLDSIGDPIDRWSTRELTAPDAGARSRRNDRLITAIGRDLEQKLATTSVAVIGLSGGGSHVCQQLTHTGFGRVVPIDGDIVEEVNLGRMIGSTPNDVSRTLKTDVMLRLIRSIDPTIRVETVPRMFPDPQAVAVLKTVDLVITCVDSFLVREQINAFCRRFHIPLIDIGLGIKTEHGRLTSAFGQLIVVLPDSGCLRCSQLLSDEVLDAERRERPPGYDRNPYARGDPQVVSMNGTLASEAVNCALDLSTGYSGGSRGAGWWQYDGRAGMICRWTSVANRPGCPACAEQGHGDPQ